ncbi:hypothetical protein T439DRAFT_349050 [Meredithblackwellia eburnea MCA 4105]
METNNEAAKSDQSSQSATITFKCANHKDSDSNGCKNKGHIYCTRCNLVSYCSGACIKDHSHTHKSICNHPLSKAELMPDWKQEGDGDSLRVEAKKLKSCHDFLPPALGNYLWGNVPATPLLNLANNEGTNVQKDLGLAFPAVGGLRNLIETINELPLSYGGTLTILLNDDNAFCTILNMLVLQVLCGPGEEEEKVETALHLGWSILMPQRLWANVQRAYLSLLTSLLSTEEGVPITIGPLKLYLDFQIFELIKDMYQSPLTRDGAIKAFQSALMVKDREEFRQWNMARLKPFHKVSLAHYRECGLLLPLSASMSGFNVPNKFLFDKEGKWLQNDADLPLYCWSIDDTLARGSEVGVPSNDLFGALHQLIFQRLQGFCKRLSDFKISIHMFHQDILELADDIAQNRFKASEMSSAQRFDRIEVSNTIDLDILGIGRVLKAWGPLLDLTNPHAALVGLLMSWFNHAERGSFEKATDAEKLQIVERLMAAHPFKDFGTELDELQHLRYESNVQKATEAYYDNSLAFQELLGSQNVAATADSLGLQLREEHKILPRRMHAPLIGSTESLPVFKNSQDLYHYSYNFLERYIEVGLAPA